MAKVKNPYRKFPIPLVIAHRGGGGLAPENSRVAFAQAAAMDGVHALELDVHMTKDGVLIVSHDPDVDRMTDRHGMIKDMTLADVQACDAGYRFSADNDATHPFRGCGETIPTLAEIFETYPNHVINIDIKHHEPHVVEAFVEMVKAHHAVERVVVGSFDTATIALLRQLAPQIATCATYREVVTFVILNLFRLGRFWRPTCVSMQIPERQGRLRVITPRFVRNLQRHGVQLHVWTVNESADMERLLSWGVDGLITDYPDRMLQLLATR